VATGTAEHAVVLFRQNFPEFAEADLTVIEEQETVGDFFASVEERDTP
jgi:hypothetical protein